MSVQGGSSDVLGSFTEVRNAYLLEASPDLKTWVEVLPVSGAERPDVTLSRKPNEARLFYRLRDLGKP